MSLYAIISIVLARLINKHKNIRRPIKENYMVNKITEQIRLCKQCNRTKKLNQSQNMFKKENETKEYYKK